MGQVDNIFLIGSMGAGKSTIGRKLAARLNKEFLDSDNELENRTGVGIDVIFDIEGEDGFRRRETRLLRELVGRRGIVLATGGGAVLAEENRQLIRNNGFAVYLQASADRLAHRLRKDRQRPLLHADDRLARVRELLAQREPFYQELADAVVDTGGGNMRQVVAEICRLVESR